MLNGELAALSDDSAEAALLDGLLRPGVADGADAVVDADSIVTIYWGEEGSAAKAAGIQEGLETACPGVHVDIYPGGQPHYPYLASVEIGIARQPSAKASISGLVIKLAVIPDKPESRVVIRYTVMKPATIDSGLRRNDG